jgi:glycosyltransferase involved in cell wall biosynthesis
MKVLHLIDSLGLGGAERLLSDIVNGIGSIEHHVVILNGPDTLRPELPAHCRFTNLNRTSYRQVFSKARQLRNYINEHGIELVHSHLYFSNIIARIGTPRHIPLFNSLHVVSSLDNYNKNRLSLVLDKLTYRKRHHIIAVSKVVMDDFDKWVGLKSPSTVLYNFIDDRYFGHEPKKSFGALPLRLVAVGNLRYQKNFPYLLEAFKKMPSNVTLDIYGEGPLREELQSVIEQHNLNVTLKGTHSGMYSVLPRYDAYVMSSFFEGQPLSLLEAIGCGLPALLSDVPVLREVTGEHAEYFQLGDPEDLVRIVTGILDGSVNIYKHTEPALQKISAFARKEIYFRHLLDLYSAVSVKPAMAAPTL